MPVVPRRRNTCVVRGPPVLPREVRRGGTQLPLSCSVPLLHAVGQSKHIPGNLESRRKACLCRLDDNQVFFHDFNTACFRIMFNVPGARSSPGFPGTVTKPSLAECLYCQTTVQIAKVMQQTAPGLSPCVLEWSAGNCER